MTKSLFDASDIEDFFNKNQRSGQELLPYLVERLVQETAPQAKASFPSGDHISKPGYDGEVDNPMLGGSNEVPQGKSVWELGTDKDPKKKFKTDLKKRSENPLGYTKSETSYCFVTPHRFPNSESEIEESPYKPPYWKAIKIYDADGLQSWLSKCPKTELWFAGEIGKLPANIERLQDFYHRYASISADQNRDGRKILPPALLLTGRKENLDPFMEWLGQDKRDGKHFGPNVRKQDYYVLQGETASEAAAFVYAALYLSEKFSLAVQSLIVKTKADIEAIVAKDSSSGKNLLLVVTAADVEPSILQTLANKGWEVVWAVDFQNKVSEDKQRLILPQNHALSDSLERAFPQQKNDDYQWAYRTSVQSGRSINRLLSLLRQDQIQKTEEERLEQLLPIILAGGFISSYQNHPAHEDLKIIETLSGGKSWAKLERIFLKENAPHRLDGKLIKIGNKGSSEISWHLRAPQADLIALSSLFTSSDGENLKKACLEVLSKNYKNYSSLLKKGLAKSLAIMGSFPDDFPNLADMRSWAQEIIKDIFEANQKDIEWWKNCWDILPNLVEPNPEVFLNYIQSNPECCNRDHIFTELHRLGQRLPYFSRVITILISIHKSSTWYMPFEFLERLFKSHMLQDSISFEKWEKAFSEIIQKNPDLGWKLLISNSYEPKFWKTSGPVSKWHQAFLFVSKELVLLAEAYPEKRDQRWAELIEKWEGFFYHTQPTQPRLFLDEWRQNTLNILTERLEKEGSDMPLLRSALHDLLKKRRLFPKFNPFHEAEGKEQKMRRADWALSEENLQALKALTPLLVPTRQEDKFLWAFGREAHFIPKSGFLDDEPLSKELHKEQRMAVKEILSTYKLQEFITLAKKVKFPKDLGFTLAKINTAESRRFLGTLLNLEEPIGEQIAWFLNFQFDAVSQKKDTYFYDLWQEAIKEHWGDLAETRILLQLSPTLKLWQEIDVRPEGIQQNYWQKIHLGYHDDISVDEVFRRFNAAKRPKVIFQWIGSNKKYLSQITNMQNVTELLFQLDPNEFLNNDSFYLGELLEYYLGELLEYLGKNALVPRETLAKLEMKFYHNLRNTHGSAKYIFEELAENPDLFVEFIRDAFLSENDCQTEETKQTKEEALRVRLASQILDDWTSFRLHPSRSYNSVQNQLSGKIPDQVYRCLPGWHYGEFDAQKLRSWIEKVQQELKNTDAEEDSDRKIGELIGQMASFEGTLSFPEGLPEIVEEFTSDALYRGLFMSLPHRRGVFCKAIFEGGAQEWALAELYQKGAEKYSNFPKLSKALRDVAASYQKEAKNADDSANRQDLTGIFSF